MSPTVDEIPADRDLVGVGVVVVVVAAATAAEAPSAVRLPPVFLFLLILPGYVTTAVAYAERDREPWSFVVLVERFALSLGSSLAVLPILAVLSYLVSGELTTWGLVATVSGYVLLGAAVTAVRRSRRSDASGGGRGSRPFGSREEASASVGWSSGRLSPLTVVLAASVVVAVAALGVAVTVPSHGEAATDLHLLTEQGDRLVANEYPDALTADGSAALTVGVTNEEHRTTEYTVITEIQRVQVDGRSVVVVEKRRIDRHAFELGHGESWRERQEFEATLTGENLRFVTYLYRGEPPENPTTDSAYRSTYLWIDAQPSVTAGE